MFTVGDLLKNGRKKKGLTIIEVEKKTRVRAKYIEALERNDWTVFPSKVYISGTIRSYSTFLDIEPDKSLAYFRRDYEKHDEIKFRKKLASLQFLPETKKIVVGGVLVVCLLFVIYFAYQFNLYLSPPRISIIKPQNHTFRNVVNLHIIGQTEKDATVKIFNETLFSNANGQFEYDLPLRKGRNTIKMEVTGANGKKNYLIEEYILE
jgi:transcriptional regulator with XRE-family HTH domain